MELRHLRCFLAVAEELHFARAAEKLHIDQSPLSRTIKELEEDLGAQLFTRTTRSTRLTSAGKIFLERVPRVFLALEQARDGVKSAAGGFVGQLRISLADGVSASRMPPLLARCREEDPEIDIRLFEVSLEQQIRGLHDDFYDVGFSMTEDAGDGIVVSQAWEDELMVAVPARHPLLAYRQVPLAEVLRYPLALCDPTIFGGHARQVDRSINGNARELLVAQRVASYDVMMTLVSAGLALGFAGAEHIAASRVPGVVARRLAGTRRMLVTYLLHRGVERSEILGRFVERVASIDLAADACGPRDS